MPCKRANLPSDRGRTAQPPPRTTASPIPAFIHYTTLVATGGYATGQLLDVVGHAFLHYRAAALSRHRVLPRAGIPAFPLPSYPTAPTCYLYRAASYADFALSYNTYRTALPDLPLHTHNAFSMATTWPRHAYAICVAAFLPSIPAFHRPTLPRFVPHCALPKTAFAYLF